jgi:hypothetical protein
LADLEALHLLQDNHHYFYPRYQTDPSRYPEKINVLTPHPTKPVYVGSEGRSQGNMNQSMNRGALSQGMQSQGMPQGNRGGFVSHLDRDNDGRVSRSEFDGPADQFDILDKNNDGYLAEDEAPQGPPR